MTGMFVGLHVLLAERTNVPQLAITEDEGKSFMSAAQNVMRHYSVETTQKTLDWIAFAGVSAGIYMPRLAAIGIERRANKERRAAAPVHAAPSGSANLHVVPDTLAGSEDGHNG
jgi:hypothetical protein